MARFEFYSVDKRRQYEKYVENFKFDQLEPTPWTPLKSSLKDCKLALVTTAGVRLKNQPVFYIDKEQRCNEYREISVHLNKSDLVFSHPLLDTSYAQKDINVLIPIDRMIELAESKIISELNESFFSFLCLGNDIENINKISKEVVSKLKRYNVDVVFLFTASHTCNLVGGIVARELEKQGISTIALLSIKEVAEEVKLPRCLIINLPFGMLLGKAHTISLQRSIINDMVSVIKTVDRPGKIMELTYKWEGQID